MANRQDSGSNSAHENQRPTSHNEEAVPEMMDDEEFEDSDTEDEEEEEDEGRY
jgi:hypothetical protein